MNNNDERILAIKKTIEEKEAELNKTSRYRVLTNCMYTIPYTDKNVNLRTLGVDNLNALAIELNAILMSANDLLDKGFMTTEEWETAMTYHGYDVRDWLSDMKGLKDELIRRHKEKELESARKQLDTLLSADKQTELAINDIVASLNL